MRVESTTQAIPELAGDQSDVQLLPFGPVRADVVESAEFLFFYVGEAILHYHPRLFFKHRGMEKRFEGLAPERGVVLAERVSGVGSVAHALAYCQAVEAAAGLHRAAARASSCASLLAEMERLYNHLHYFGHLCHTTTLKVGEAEGKLLEERAKQLNTRLTGSRFLRSLLCLGGLRRDLAPKPWLAAELDALGEQFAAYARHMENTASHLDRLITTGQLDRRTRLRPGRDRAGRARLRRRPRSAARPPLRRLWRTCRRRSRCARTATPMPARRCAWRKSNASIALIKRALDALPDGPLRADCNGAAEQRRPGLGGVAARHAVLCRACRRRRQARARQDQIAVVLELARVSVHRARQQHDGLRDQ